MAGSGSSATRSEIGDATLGDALGDIHRRHYRDLVRLAVLLVDDEATAEEIVQEAFLRVFRRWDQLREPEAAAAYVRRAVVNGARDRLRRRRVRRLVLLPRAAEVASAEETVVLADEHERILSALRGLPTRQREVLTLRYFGGLSEADIAVALNISTGAVKSTAHKGIAALRGLYLGFNHE